jgi:hypothetical protein
MLRQGLWGRLNRRACAGLVRGRALGTQAATMAEVVEKAEAAVPGASEGMNTATRELATGLLMKDRTALARSITLSR